MVRPRTVYASFQRVDGAPIETDGETIHGEKACRRDQRRWQGAGDAHRAFRGIRGPAVHRSARQVAAHRAARLHHRGGRVPRRHHVRRLLDRRLEGDQQVRHDPDAGRRHRGDGSVLRQAEPDPVLRHRRAVHRPALQPRPALHRQEGRGLSEVVRHRRHRLFRSGGRVLRVRQRQVRHRRQLRHLSARQPGRPAGQPEGLSGRQHGPSARRSRAATSRSRRSTAKATCAPRCCRPWARWAW